MKSNSAFSLENLLISVAGHLAAVALMVVGISLVAGPMEKIIAPERIQIIEMDLTNVKITRDETLVYNTDAPKTSEKQPESKPESKKPEPAAEEPDWQAVKQEQPKPNAPAEPQPETPKSEKAPVQKTTVRVNRETASLNRTMTVSVVDAMRLTMTRCWQFDRSRPDIDDIRAVAHLTLNQNGMVRDMWFEGAARADPDPAFAYILETIRMAVSVCQPFKMLPLSEYDAWREIQLTFYPSNATVQ